MMTLLDIRIFSVLFFSIFCAMLGIGIILPVLPLYAETIGASGLWIGAIFAGFSIARSVCMPFVGKMSDKGGRKSFIATGLFIYGISSLGYVYSDSAQMLFLVRTLQGFSSAMIVPIAMAYIGDITPKDKEGAYMGMFTVSLFMGFGLGPLIGGALKEFCSVQAAFWSMGGMCMLAFLLVLLLLPATYRPPGMLKQPSATYRTLLASRRIRGVICYRYISSFSRATVLTFLPLFVSYRLDFSGFEIGLVMSASVLCTSFLQYPFGRLADICDRRRLIVGGNVLYSAAIVTLPFAGSFRDVLVLSLLLGVTGALALPAATALVVEEGKRSGMGSSMAVFNVAMSLGLGSGPLISGIIHDAVGLDCVFYFVSGMGILGSLAAGWFLQHAPPAGPLKPPVAGDV